MRAQVTTGSQGASAAPSVSATMPPFKDRGSSAPKAESSITLCGSLPRQYRCSPQPIWCWLPFLAPDARNRISPLEQGSAPPPEAV